MTGGVGKKKFYNTGFKNLKNKVALPKFHGEEFIENFDDLRSVFTDPRNDKFKFALRTPPENEELMVTDLHVDRNFIILQSPSQRRVMANSTVLNVDQNHKATPPGASRTLTICAKYKGNNKLFVLKKKYL